VPAEAGDLAERALFAGALGALVLGAWLALGLVGASPWAGYLDHTLAVDAVELPYLARAAIFVAGWTMMSVAMMLPSSLPLVTVFRTMTRRRPRPGVDLGLLIAGYLAIWALFGLVVFGADTVIHVSAEQAGLFATYEWLLVGLTLLVAGLFQFAPLKYACLSQCRSPIGFVASHWHGGGHRGAAFGLGVRHGIFCVGCCWALMLVMFAVGGVNLGWMLALGAVMFLEKAVSWGRHITVPVGVLLALWGLGLLLGLPLPLSPGA
jgi:predicted metal-binding membrane protein